MSEKRKPNPYIDSYNYLSGYQDSVEKLKQDTKVTEFGRLCHNIFFMTDDGKRFMELLVDNYLIPSLVNRDNPNYEIACVYAEGFKAAYRHLKTCAETHANYIKSETNI